MSSTSFLYLSPFSDNSLPQVSNSECLKLSSLSDTFSNDLAPNDNIQSLRQKLSAAQQQLEKVENGEFDDNVPEEDRSEDKVEQMKDNLSQKVNDLSQHLKEGEKQFRESQFSIPIIAQRVLEEIHTVIQPSKPESLVFVSEGVYATIILLEIALDLEKLSDHVGFLLLGASPIEHQPPPNQKEKTDDEENEEEEGEEKDPDPLFNTFDGYAKENDSTVTLYSGKPFDDEQVESLAASLFTEEKMPSWFPHALKQQSAQVRLAILESLLSNNFNDHLSILKRLTRPIKIIVGADDANLNKKYLNQIQSQIPTLMKSEIIFHPSNHFVSIEAPDKLQAEMGKIGNVCQPIHAPQDISGKWIDQIVLNGVPSMELSDVDFQNIGDGAIGSINRISFKVADKFTAFKLKDQILFDTFIIKLQPTSESEEYDLLMNQVQIHRREALFYTRISRIIPRLSFLKVPRLYAALEKDTVLVMEDINDGTPLDLKEGLNWEQSEHVMKLLATIHALPFSGSASEEVWKQIYGDFEEYDLNNRKPMANLNKHLAPKQWNSLKSKFSDEDEFMCDNVIEEALTAENIENQLSEVPSLSPEEEDLNSLLINGDFFSLNILTRGKNKASVVIDWQFTHFGDPFSELAFFLYSSCDSFTLRQHERDLIRTYHNILKSLCGDSLETLTFDRFYSLFEKHGKFAGLVQMISGWEVMQKAAESNSDSNMSIMDRLRFALEDVWKTKTAK